ncbi:MAG: pyridoxal-phosphate dependent enzyme [Betaproteobacteria bacterium]|nr:pyridoxal-phosphate dependent enzyme [Betaproteobacteria bacterium]
MNEYPLPVFRDVLAARSRIAPYLRPTPLYSYPALNELLGTRAYVKHENHQPVGAFKVRGGVNLVAQMTAAERQRGLISASTGNHGQSIAYAGQLFGARVLIVVPEGANPGKVAAMQGMSAEVIFHGAKFEEAVQHCESLARQHGYRYVHAANEPLLIAGVGTHTLEILLEEPDIEVVIVPLGMGSGVAGACIAAHGINPLVQVIAVQSEASPAGYESWKQQALVAAPNRTFAEGIATGSAAELTQHVMREHLHDFVLVSDDEIRQAMVWMIERAHTLAEGAGAAPLAAAYRMRAELRGRKVALICSGGNSSLEHLRQALAL